MKTIYDSVKHSRDEKYVNLLLVSNEGALPLLELERTTNSRVDNLVQVGELHISEAQQYIHCCLEKAADTNNASDLADDIYKVAEEVVEAIGGNMLFLQNFCTLIQR